MLFKRSVSLSLSLVSSSFLFKLISRLIIVLFFLARSTKKIKMEKTIVGPEKTSSRLGNMIKREKKSNENK